MLPKDRLIFALDVPNRAEAEKYIDLLHDEVGMFKIGFELFIACGHSVIPFIQKPIMLDLKLYDIPETVERAVYAAGELGVKFLTVHIQQQASLMRAMKAAEKANITLLGITLLSSMTWIDCKDLCGNGNTHQVIISRIKHGLLCGLQGFVCSGEDIATVRKLAMDATIVVPGVRPFGASDNDQKRVVSPDYAIRNGADYIVVGRPIRDAKDPVQAAKSIVSEIETTLSSET